MIFKILFIFPFSKQMNESYIFVCVPCGDNKCIWDGKCECNSNYTEDAKGVCIPICNEGHEWSNELQKCRPSCNPTCGQHSECVGTNTCECHKGYSIDYRAVCFPVCTNKCDGNQDCVAPDTCACSSGYIWNNNTEKCVPQCVPSCAVNSFCKSPGYCECHKGFNPETINNKLRCVVPIVWWIYLLIAVLMILILASVGGIIYYFASRSQRINYYPNKNFANTTEIDS